jgi:hypothetical protein
VDLPVPDARGHGSTGLPAGEPFAQESLVADAVALQVNQGHQKFRIAAMAGTLDGNSVHSYRSSPSAYISFNHFVFIDATHGTTC